MTAVRGLTLDRARLVELDGGWACPAETADGVVVVVVGGASDAFPVAERAEVDGESLAVVERSRGAARALRRLVPSLRPRPLGTASSFGFGDRLGRATPGHARALVASGSTFIPVFAQQSARELERLGRTFDDVLDCATWGVLDSGWRGGYGADADHLRTVDEVRAAVAAGFTMFTLDPSAHVDSTADGAAGIHLEEKVAALPWAELGDGWRSLRRRYADRAEGEVASAAATFGSALAHAATLAGELPGHQVDLEVSIDETPRPTTPFEHVFVARELRRLGVDATSIAPRFPGRWPKGTDVSGDSSAIAAGIAEHARVAIDEGHKLSVHSGSDKFLVYAALARAGCALHVKTSGTSYLEALRVVAAADPQLFRHVLTIADSTFAEQRRSYTLDDDAAVPDPAASDEELPALLDARGSRQALHVTFGAVLTDHAIAARLDACLERETETYAATLERHLGRHLELLEPAA